MKFKKQLKFATFFMLLATLFVSCEDAPKIGGAATFNKGVMVVNEGVFPAGVATLTYWNPDSVASQTCYFEVKNGRSLGNVGMDLKQYGSKIYTVVNMSSTIEVISSIDGKSITQIGLKNDKGEGRQPRYIAFSGRFGYVCSFDGTVVKIDTSSLSVVSVCNVGRNPDGIEVVGSKLFVSNSGGLDPNQKYDNTVSVIDLNTFTETKKIEIGMNPGMMQADSEGDLYVITRGVFGVEPKSMYIINTATEIVKAKIDVQPEKFVIVGDWAYMFGITYDNEWTATGSYFKYNVKEEKLYNEPFISVPSQLKVPYSLAVDPISGDFYIGDCKNYTQTGDLFHFSKQGILLGQCETGVIPSAILILR